MARSHMSAGRAPSCLWAPPALRPVGPHATLALVAAILVAGAGLRLWYSARLPIESDEAIVGLMARRILEGDRPVFYYGQDYMGALEAYLVALSFWVGGYSVFAMRVVTIAIATAFIYLVYLVGSRVSGPAVGLISATYVSISPVFLTAWSIKVRGGFVETVVFGTLLLLLLHDVAWRGRVEVWRVLLLGLVAGVAFWVSQLVLPYLAVVGIFLLLRLGVRAFRVAVLALPAFVVGSLPLWLYNLDSGFATFRELLAMHVSDTSPLGPYLLGHARAVFLDSAPVVLGFVEPRFDLPVLRLARNGQWLAFALGLAACVGLVALALGWAVLVARRGWRQLVESPEAPLASLAVLVVSAVLVTNNMKFWWGEPRYLLSIYSAVPFFVARLVGLGRRSRGAGALLLVLVLLVNARGDFLVVPTAILPTVEYRGTEYASIPADTSALAAFLLQRGDDRVYADYWIAYVLAFESQERIAVAPVDDQLRISVVRLPDALRAVQESGRPAYVFVANTGLERDFAGRLSAAAVKFRRVEVSGFAVYDELNPPQQVPQG